MVETLDRDPPGRRLIDGHQVQDAVGKRQGADCNQDLVALAGGGQAGATQLQYGFNEVATVATAADSVQLPAAVAGAEVSVVHSGAENMTVYGKSSESDTIDGTAGDTGVTQAAGANTVYRCVKNGAWHSFAP